VTRLGLSAIGSTLASGVLPGVLGIAATLLVERHGDGGSLRQASQRLGISRTNPTQLVVAIVAAAPLAAAYVILFGPLGVSARLVEHWPLQLFKLVVAQGIAEEVIFRGFVFRRLRPGRSFGHAATLSAAVFSLVHLCNLVNGLTPTVLFRIGVSLVFAVVLTYPASYLFERGRGSIWGFGVLHVAIDSIDLFRGAAKPGLGFMLYLGAVLGTVPLVFLGSRLLLPSSSLRRPASEPRLNPSGSPS
jgi:membrane protease YdiL (CAAX protease family)